MPALFFYFKDAVPTGATLHRSLQDGGTPPAASTTGTGWVVNQKATGQSCIQNGGSKVARTDSQWGTTLQPSAAPSQTIGDCWRSENTYTGTFANTDWVVACYVRSVTAAYDGRLKLAFRLWRSTNANGTGAVELTSGRVVSAATTGNLSTSADSSISFTSWAPGASIIFNNEYLFMNWGVEVTSNGSSNSMDVLFRAGSGETSLITPSFTPLIAPPRIIRQAVNRAASF